MDRPRRLASRRPHAALAVATVLAVAATSIAPDLALARRRETVEVISTRVVLTPSEGSFKICADEKHTLEVTAEEEVIYRWTNDAPGVTHTSHRPLARSVRITATSDATGTASITPASAQIRAPRGSAAFDVTGEDPGLTSVEFTMPGSNTNYAVSVNVEECSYKLSASAEWKFPGPGFKPHMFADIRNLVLKRLSKNDYFAVGTVINNGYGTPVSGCQPVIRVPNTRVLVRGDIVPGQYRQEIKLNLSYDNVPAGMSVTCPRVPGQGTSSDTAHIAVLITNMKAFEWMDTKTVSGHLGESKLGTVASDTFLVLELVRP